MGKHLKQTIAVILMCGIAIGVLRAGIVVQANGETGNGGQDNEPLDPLAQEAQAALNALGGLV